MDRFDDFDDAPTGAQSGGAAEIAAIGAIANWCESLHGKRPLARALKGLAESLGAEAAALARVSRAERGETRAVTFDAAPGRLPLERSFARALLGSYFDKARPGTAWFRSVLDEDVDPGLQQFQSRRRLGDLVVIPLDSGNRTIDFLELHFPARQSAHRHALICFLADTLARTWQNRAEGQYTEALLRVDAARQMTRPGVPVLSVQNPARLSRAEYRLCLLLSQGRSAQEARAELDISESTLRSHLRNIYAKTETHGQNELIYLLLSAAPFESGRSRRGSAA